MANDKYAHIPGTSSISNGGKNISQRIEAIVRFKKYPKGMSLVSTCIMLVLFSLLGSGNAYIYSAMDYQPGPLKELQEAMAMARLNRCTTIAGVLDTYTKGLMLENGIYIATASSLSMHDEEKTLLNLRTIKTILSTAQVFLLQLENNLVVMGLALVRIVVCI